MAEKLTKRDQFVLTPFAEVFAGWSTKLETMPDFELWALRRAVKKPGETNCWWAIYHAANWLRPAIETECFRRKRIKATARRAALALSRKDETNG
jgi:hypothetical protein